MLSIMFSEKRGVATFNHYDRIQRGNKHVTEPVDKGLNR
jgi:hypothetical protein